jgi:hypothetical protein
MDAVAPPSMSSAPMYEPSAPSFEDLLDGQHHQDHQPNSLESMQAVPPPNNAQAASCIDEDVLAALDPAERKAFLEEQRQIMEQIEKTKANNQALGAAA